MYPASRPLPLSMGEVAERSEDGEGTGAKPSQSPAVTAPPKGEPRTYWHKKWSVSVPIRSIHCFTTTH